jgi:hypothetical protein
MTVSSATWGTTSDVSLGEIRESTAARYTPCRKNGTTGKKMRTRYGGWSRGVGVGGSQHRVVWLVDGDSIISVVFETEISLKFLTGHLLHWTRCFHGPSSPYRQMPVWYRCPFYRVPENGNFHGMSRRMQAFCDKAVLLMHTLKGTPSSCNCSPMFSTFFPIYY